MSSSENKNSESSSLEQETKITEGWKTLILNTPVMLPVNKKQVDGNASQTNEGAEHKSWSKRL